MSTKIKLEFETKIDLEFLTKGIRIRLIRLISRIKLRGENGFTKTYDAIIDTGNPITIIPFSIWNKASIRIISHEKVKLYGLGTDNKSAIKGNIGQVTIIFLDEEKSSVPIKLKAYLIEDDRAPFLIGFEDILTEIKLVSDYKGSIAYLELPNTL
jgi:predicted aspartyl protease